MTPLREVDAEAAFAGGLERERGKLALSMVLHGWFFSQGWRIAECVWRDGAVLRYACFPLQPK